MSVEDDPFAVLDLAPTMQVSAIKAAYFSCLAKHRLHQDSDQFRRVRSAYETLMSPAGLSAAYYSTALDVDSELASHATRFAADLERVEAERSRQQADAAARARFVGHFSKLRLGQVK